MGLSFSSDCPKSVRISVAAFPSSSLLRSALMPSESRKTKVSTEDSISSSPSFLRSTTRKESRFLVSILRCLTKKGLQSVREREERTKREANVDSRDLERREDKIKAAVQPSLSRCLIRGRSENTERFLTLLTFVLQPLCLLLLESASPGMT